MKVLFSLTYFTPYVSGLTNYVLTLAKCLVEDGVCQPTVMCMKHEKGLAKTEEIAGIEVRRATPLLKLSRGFASIEWVFMSWLLVKKTDVLVINLPQVEAVATVLAAKWMKKPVVAIYHARVELRGGLADKIIQLVLEMCNWIVMRLSDVVITYTQDYAQNNRELLRTRGKVKWVYPPIVVPKIDKPLSRKIAQMKPAGVKLWIGMAARLAEDKGFEYLIRAIPILEKKVGRGTVGVMVAGPMQPVGEERYKSKIMAELDPVKDRFIFLGEIPNSRMGSFYKQIDVLAVPSVLESFSIVQVEAMMLGVPVVISQLPGARVPVKKLGMGYLVEPRNPTTLAEAIVWAAKNRQRLKKKMGLVRKEFNILKTKNFYRHLFEKLLPLDDRRP